MSTNQRDTSNAEFQANLKRAFETVSMYQVLLDYHPELSAKIRFGHATSRINAAWEAGSDSDRIIVDPNGFYDFKTEESYTVWRYLEEIQGLSKKEIVAELFFRAGISTVAPQRQQRSVLTPRTVDQEKLSAEGKRRAAYLAEKLKRAERFHSFRRAGESAYLARKKVANYESHGYRFTDGVAFGSQYDVVFFQIMIRSLAGDPLGFQRCYDAECVGKDRDRAKDNIGLMKGGFVLVAPREISSLPDKTALRDLLSDGYTLDVCEGVATGLSICKAKPRTIMFCALNAGNMFEVAQLLRNHYGEVTEAPSSPEQLPVRICLWADNDQWKKDNTGLEKARAAAKAAKCHIRYPIFKLAHADKRPTDFNDLHLLEGLEAVWKRA